MKRIISLCLVFALLVGGLMALVSCKAAGERVGGYAGGGGAPPSIAEIFSRMLGITGPTGRISSDGEKFTIDAISGVHVLTQIPEGESLPAVGDRETLLKLLLDRGALYDDSEVKYKVFGQNQSEAFFSEASGSWGEAPVPDASIAISGDAVAPQSAPNDMNMARESMSVPGGADMDDSAMAFDDGGGGHSRTNEQVEGVSEGDIVKTDGRYIYALSPNSNALRIIRANGAEMEVVSTIYNENAWGSEFYLIGSDRLAIVCNEYAPIHPLPAVDDPNKPDARIAMGYGWYSNSFTSLVIYDISDRSAPFEARKISMEGWAVSTRVIGGVVYMVTNKYIYTIPFDQADSPNIMPYTRDTAAGEAFEPVGLDCIYYVPDSMDSSYLMIGAIDVYSNEPFAPEAYLGAGSNLYMSQNAMYVTQDFWEQPVPAAAGASIWSPGGHKTRIMRFKISGTEVSYTGRGTVDGFPINQYSMDEHRGYFRIASTDWEKGTFVTVLDVSNMQTVGRTEPLAPGEQMQSMRFMGDMGYVVTFLNVDPLFTVDLADPRNPKMLGELKIPGFSQYLHPLGGGLLMGIGRDTQELYTRDSQGVETVVGFQDAGMKVSLFDVSDPFDPIEADVLLLGNGWGEISHNPRALMCDSARGQYGFMVENWDDRGNWMREAHILRVRDGGVSIAATLELGGYFGIYGSRLCFIGNTLYLVHEAGIDTYDYTTFARLGGIAF